MSTFNAFDISPVPTPGPDALAPEPFRGIYGMPMFLTLPARDLEVSTRFWTQGLGFISLFSIPGRLAHLRRWAFQDVLLVSDEEDAGARPGGATLSIACVLGQLDDVVRACERLRPGCAQPARTTPWNSREVEVTTPEGLRLILTAALPWDPASEQASGLRSIGIDPGEEQTPA